MKTKSIFLLLFFTLSLIGFAQQKTGSPQWEILIGEWKGEGGGQPGQGGGTFSFSYELNQKIIVRKSHSEYPASNQRPATIHDDLMVIYQDAEGKLSNAIYFDNEDHVIKYAILSSGNKIVLTSEKAENSPVFRLTYTIVDNNTVDTKFEMSQDGQNFMAYVEGRSVRVK